MRRGRLRREELKSIKKTIEEGRQEKEEIKKERHVNMRLYILVAVIVAVILLAGYFSITGKVISSGGKYDDFVSCASSRGLILFGSDKCEYCSVLRSSLAESFMLVNYIDCSSDQTRCIGVMEYPTWNYNGQYIRGNFSLEEIGIITKCVL